MKDENKTRRRSSKSAVVIQPGNKIKKSGSKIKKSDILISENFYRMIFENTGTATAIFNEDSTILLINGEFEKLCGYSREEVEGRKTWLELVFNKDDLERMKEYHRLRPIDPSSVPKTYEYQLIDREGRIKDIVATISTMPGGKQRLASLLDITDRKRMEADLQESKRRLADIIDFLPDATCAIDLSGKVIAWNRAIEEMTGIKAENMLGKGNYEYVLPFYGIRRPTLIDLACGFNEQNEKKYDFIKKEGDVLLTEVEVTLRGVTRVLWAKASPLYDSRGKVTGAIESARDITEQRRMEETVRRSQKMQAIGTLAGGIAHDFNNILGAIMGYAEMAKDELPAESMVTEYINELLSASERAKFLVQQILAFSQAENQIKPFLVAPIVKEVVKLLSHTMPSTIHIKQNIYAKDTIILADATQIHHVLMNLCTNAGYAMRKHGGTLTVSLNEIEIFADDKKGSPSLDAGVYLELKVADTGHGIDPAIIDKIFDPFFTTKRKGEGSGMGLAVVHGIVHGYGGHINVLSKPGAGTTFTIHFPVVSENLRMPKKEAQKALVRGNERIMIVDDQEYILKMMHRTLSYLGYTIVSEQNPLKAWALFQHDPSALDMIITDQTMPDLTGADMAKKMLSIRPDIPIILCTGYSELVSPEEAKALGIREYLMKPISINDLAQTIRNVFDGKRS
ncbi:MAG: PAS domain S-box protein [Smithella sp.]